MFKKTMLQLMIGLLVVSIAACASSPSSPRDETVATYTENQVSVPSSAPSDASAVLVISEEASFDRTLYPIVDTGQSACYDDGSTITCPTQGQAFYGQDAQFDGNQPSYTLSADGLTVYDNVTGLTWTQSPDLDGDGDINVDDKLTFAEAQAYPNTLNTANYGGYNDWRLPTIKELYSLMNFRGTDPSGPTPTNLIPFIDTTYFDFGYGDQAAGERIIDAQFWSSNTYVGTVFGNQTATFGLNLADGRIKGYPVNKLNYVYFVRGNTDYGINDLSNNGDGTISDNATGLMWQQDDSAQGMNWEPALAYCESLSVGGYTDWRLPNVKELQSIVDYGRSPDTTGSAAIDPLFSVSSITNEAGQNDYAFYWSSTTHASERGGMDAAYVAFGRAMGYMHNTWMDVHGAGAQRSDPKTGDAGDFPVGRGPQGDARRAMNYVRCVRGGDAVLDPDGDPTANRTGITVEPTTGEQQQPSGQPPTAGEQPGHPNSGASNGQPGQPGPDGQPPQEMPMGPPPPRRP